MDAPSMKYDDFYKVLFESPNLGGAIQEQLQADLDPTGIKDKEGDIRTHSKRLLKTALEHKYSVVTRFVPPYCATVTFYKNTIGFVTVSSLASDFDTEGLMPFEITCKGGTETKYISNGAINTLAQAYTDAYQFRTLRSSASGREGLVDNPRNKKAHARALGERREKRKEDKKKSFQKANKPLEHDEIYIRLEGLPPESSPKTLMRYKPTGPQDLTDVKFASNSASKFAFKFVSYLLYPITRVWRAFIEGVRLLVHCMLVCSKVNFCEGPASVRNDFLYNTHDGKYAKEVRMIEGELSSHLSLLGRIFALLNLDATNAIASASVALFTSAWSNNSAGGFSHTGLLIAGSLLLGLRVLQQAWTFLITTSRYENIANNDFRVRNIEQAATLFGLKRRYFQLFLAIISPQYDVAASGFYNSYIDISRTGVLEVSDKIPAEIFYHAGYITSALEPTRSTIAAWVPFETHLVTYTSNDNVRKMTLIDDRFRLSRPGRLEWDVNTPSRRRSLGPETEVPVVLKLDGDILQLPEELRIYGPVKQFFAG